MQEQMQGGYPTSPFEQAMCELCQVDETGRVIFDARRFEELGSPRPDELVRRVLGEPASPNAA